MGEVAIRKLLVNSVLYGIAPHITKIVAILTYPLVTPHLTEADFGIYGLITTYTSALSAFMMLGLGIVLYSSYYNYRDKYIWRWRQLYGFLNQWMFLFGILQIFILYLLLPSSLNNNKILVILLVTLPTIFFGPTAQMCTILYQYNHKATPIAVRSIIFGSLTIILNVVFIAENKMGYMGWVWSAFIANMGLNISYLIPLHYKFKIKPIYNYKRSVIKQSLKISLPTIPHYYAAFLLNVGNRIVMDKQKVSIDEIGKYSFASSFSGAFEMFAAGLGSAFNPRISECYRDSKEHLARLFIWLMQLIMLASTVIVCLFMKEIFLLLVKNKGLQSTYQIAIILIMSMNYRPMYIATSNKLFFYNETKHLWLITFVAGLLNIGLCIILIPIFGIWSAVFIFYFSMMYMGYSGFFLKDFKRHNTINYFPKLIFTATILLTMLVYYAANYETYIKIAIATFYIVIIVIIARIFLINIAKETNETSKKDN